MSEKYRCPKCKSNRVKIGYPDIECANCSWSEPLIDFPISWDYHRALCLEYGKPDPGACEPPAHSDIQAIEQRLDDIEQTLGSITAEDMRQLNMKGIYDRLQGLERGLALTQRTIAKSRRGQESRQSPSRGVAL
jgi:hypothetical protein